MDELPSIKIELNSMRKTIVHALQVYHTEIDDAVNEQLREAVDNFDFGTVVQEVAKEVIEKAVHDSVTAYFNWGEGRKIIAKRWSQMRSSEELNHE